jgi:hypothetical protein
MQRDGPDGAVVFSLRAGKGKCSKTRNKEMNVLEASGVAEMAWTPTLVPRRAASVGRRRA